MAFDPQAFLASPGVAKTIRAYGRYETIFTPGDACDGVLYIQSGGVNLSALSKGGTETVVATLGPGDFFGEGCLAGQTARVGTATAITPSTILVIAARKMRWLLQRQPALSDRFISHMLARNIQIEADLIEQLVGEGPKRAARPAI